MLGSKMRLGDLLVQAGRITKEQLSEMLIKQKGGSKKLGEVLIEEGVISEEEILQILEYQLGIKRVNLDSIDMDKEAIAFVPEAIARRYNLIAVKMDEKKIKIFVAMEDPLNFFAMDDVRLASGKEVIPLLAKKDDIRSSIDKCYSNTNVEKMAEEINRDNIKKERKDEDLSLDDVKNAPVVKLVDSIFVNAVKSDASDIHVEPYDKYVKIRYRIDGALQEVLRTPSDSAPAITTRIKIMANLNIAEKRVPQDGRVVTKVDGKDVDLRVSILPTVYGEKIVIRILKKDGFLRGKEQLGMDKDDLEKINRIIKSPYGIILVTGPTGSGKSSTLYTVLNDLNSPELNIITVEDPVEFVMEGINQVNVNTKAGLTFAAGLRSILRQDPDIIMIGEIRDGETAQIAVRSAITGHLVLSTIHTNDAASAIIRLTDMDIEPFLVATAVTGIIAQRLVRKICPHCKEAYEAPSYEKKILGVAEEKPLKLYRGKGCNSCSNKGYAGRLGVYEIMEITKEHRELIQKSATTEDIRDLNEKLGFKSLSKACANLVLSGTTTVEELLKLTFMND